jgi:hypothetical protein
MSWGLGKIVGKPTNVKQKVIEYFKQIENNSFNDHEQQSVQSAKEIILHELDFCIENETSAVEVEAGGSCSSKSGEIRTAMNRGSTTFKVRVEPIYNYLE